MALAGQKPGSCQPGGATADHGNAPAGGLVLGYLEIYLMAHAPVGDKTLQMINGNRFINQDPPTAGLTETGTDPAHGKGHRVTLHDQAQGLFILTPGHMGNIALDIDLTGTGQVAGGLTVTKMGCRDIGKPLLPVENDRFRIGKNLHPVPGRGDTGTEQSLGRQA